MLHGGVRSNGKPDTKVRSPRSAGCSAARPRRTIGCIRESFMNCERSLIAAAVFLMTGLGLIFGFTHGTVGFGAAYPVAGTALDLVPQDHRPTGTPRRSGH